MNSVANLVVRHPGSSVLNSNLIGSSLGARQGTLSHDAVYHPLDGIMHPDGHIASGLGESDGDILPDSIQTKGVWPPNSMQIIRRPESTAANLPRAGGVPSQNQMAGQNIQSQGLLGDIGRGIGNIIGSIANTLGEGAVKTRQVQDQATINDVTAANLGVHGVGLLPSISTIQANMQNRVGAASAGAAFGSLFGPLGSLAGYGIGGALGSSLDVALPTNVSTFEGNTSGNDAGIAGSHSTSDSDRNPILQESDA